MVSETRQQIIPQKAHEPVVPARPHREVVALLDRLQMLEDGI